MCGGEPGPGTHRHSVLPVGLGPRSGRCVNASGDSARGGDSCRGMQAGCGFWEGQEDPFPLGPVLEGNRGATREPEFK